LKLFAFSDLHGDVEALKRMLKSVECESFDYILIAGDLTGIDVEEPEVTVKQAREIFDILEGFDLSYYFVWGFPFRESGLYFTYHVFRRFNGWKTEEKDDLVSIVGEVRSGDRGFTRFRCNLPREKFESAVEILEVVSTLRFGNVLHDFDHVRLGDYFLTSYPELVDEKTILLIHHYQKPTEALLQLEGHVHYGQLCRNYLNLGFVSRDDGLLGCCWLIDLSEGGPSIKWVNFGGKMREMTCPIHRDEGTFYIPSYWKKCPVCYDSRNAIFSKEVSRRPSAQVNQDPFDSFI